MKITLFTDLGTSYKLFVINLAANHTMSSFKTILDISVFFLFAFCFVLFLVFVFVFVFVFES